MALAHPGAGPSAPCGDLRLSLDGKLRLRRSAMSEVTEPECRLPTFHHSTSSSPVTFGHPLQVSTPSWLGSPFSYLISIHLTALEPLVLVKVMSSGKETQAAVRRAGTRVPTFINQFPLSSGAKGWPRDIWPVLCLKSASVGHPVNLCCVCLCVRVCSGIAVCGVVSA